MKISSLLLISFLVSLGLDAQAQQSRNSQAQMQRYNDVNSQKQVQAFIRDLFDKQDWKSLHQLIQTTDRNDYFFEALSLVITSNLERPSSNPLRRDQVKQVLRAIYIKAYQTGGLVFVHIMQNTLLHPAWAVDPEIRAWSTTAYIEAAKAGHWPELRDVLLTRLVPAREPNFILFANQILVAILRQGDKPGWTTFWKTYPALYARAKNAAVDPYYLVNLQAKPQR